MNGIIGSNDGTLIKVYTIHKLKAMLSPSNRGVVETLENPHKQRWMYNPSGFLESSITDHFSVQVWHPDLKTVENSTVIQTNTANFMTCLRGSLSLFRVAKTYTSPLSFRARLSNDSKRLQVFREESSVNLYLGNAWFNPSRKFYSLKVADPTGAVILVERCNRSNVSDLFWLRECTVTEPFIIKECAIEQYASIVQKACNTAQLLLRNKVA